MDLAHQLIGFPRHLSQHVGGFVLTRGRLDETVPIGNGAMADRTFIEWDKDDIDALGLMKVDVLALGMLTCLKRGLDFLERDHGVTYETLADLPQEDPAVYAMLAKADSVGVFQVESRAQMSMLPRLKPKEFYDLVIEVAIVRPGPIQGDMVHPYLRRRSGAEPVDYPAPHPDHGPADELKEVLQRTYGRAALPGAGHADRHHGGGLHPGRGRRPAPGDGDLPACRHDRRLRGEVRRRHDPPRLPAGLRRALLRADPRVSPPTASRRATRRASRCWSTPRPG